MLGSKNAQFSNVSHNSSFQRLWFFDNKIKWLMLMLLFASGHVETARTVLNFEYEDDKRSSVLSAVPECFIDLSDYSPESNGNNSHRSGDLVGGSSTDNEEGVNGGNITDNNEVVIVSIEDPGEVVIVESSENSADENSRSSVDSDDNKPVGRRKNSSIVVGKEIDDDFELTSKVKVKHKQDNIEIDGDESDESLSQLTTTDDDNYDEVSVNSIETWKAVKERDKSLRSVFYSDPDEEFRDHSNAKTGKKLEKGGSNKKAINKDLDGVNEKADRFGIEDSCCRNKTISGYNKETLRKKTFRKGVVRKDDKLELEKDCDKERTLSQKLTKKSPQEFDQQADCFELEKVHEVSSSFRKGSEESVDDIDNILKDSLTISQMLCTQEDDIDNVDDKESEDDRFDRVSSDMLKGATKALSAIERLNELDTDSSDDLEILRTTLTQPSFLQSVTTVLMDEDKADVDDKEEVDDNNRDGKGFISLEKKLKTEIEKAETDEIIEEKTTDDCVNRIGSSLGSIEKSFMITKKNKTKASRTETCKNGKEGMEKTSVDKHTGVMDSDSIDSEVGFFSRKRQLKALSITSEGESSNLENHLKAVESRNLNYSSTTSTDALADETLRNSEFTSELNGASKRLKHLEGQSVIAPAQKAKTKSARNTTVKKSPVNRKSEIGKQGMAKNGKRKMKKLTKLKGQQFVTSFFVPTSIQTDSDSSNDCNKARDRLKCCLNCASDFSNATKTCVVNNTERKGNATNSNNSTETYFNDIQNDATEIDQTATEISTESNTIEYTIEDLDNDQLQIKLDDEVEHSNAKDTSEKGLLESNGSKGNRKSERGYASWTQISGAFFQIEDVYMVSQNTFEKFDNSAEANGSARADGDNGSASTDGDNDSASVSGDSRSCALQVPANGESSDSAANTNAGNGMMEYVAEKARDIKQSVMQIQKNALDILMASSRKMFANPGSRQEAFNRGNISRNSGNQYPEFSGNVSTTTTLEVPQPVYGAQQARARGRGRPAGSHGIYSQGSADTRDATRKCPFYKRIPGM